MTRYCKADAASLWERYGNGTALPFSKLPPEAKKAVRAYFADEHGFAEEKLRRGLWGHFSIPTDVLITEIMSNSELGRDFNSWEDYHKWYMDHSGMADYATKRPQLWPVIVEWDHDEIIWDGWHRFHTYVERGEPQIPALIDLQEYRAATLTWRSNIYAKSGLYADWFLDPQSRVDARVTKRAAGRKHKIPPRPFSIYTLALLRAVVEEIDSGTYFHSTMALRRTAQDADELYGLVTYTDLGKYEFTVEPTELGTWLYDAADLGSYPPRSAIHSWGSGVEDKAWRLYAEKVK